MSDLLPCPFCGEVPFVMSVGMAGQPRWQHPVNDTCPIAGYYLGGWDFPVQWNQRVFPAVQPDDLIRRMDAVQACKVGPSDEWSRSTKSGYNQAAMDCAMNILRLAAALPAVQPDARIKGYEEAYQYALHLAEALRENYPPNPDFRFLGDLVGLLTQIDNMVAGLSQTDAREAALREAAALAETLSEKWREEGGMAKDTCRRIAAAILALIGESHE